MKDFLRALETAKCLQRSCGGVAGFRYMRFWFSRIANSRFKY